MMEELKFKQEEIMNIIRVSWHIEVDYNGANEYSHRKVLYMDKKGYDTLVDDLIAEADKPIIPVSGDIKALQKRTSTKINLILDGDLSKVQEGILNLVPNGELALDQWKEVGEKQKFDKLVEISSQYDIVNDWDFVISSRNGEINLEDLGVDLENFDGFIEHRIEEGR